MEINFKRFLSLLLALVMVIGMFPVTHVHVHAEENAKVYTSVLMTGLTGTANAYDQGEGAQVAEAFDGIVSTAANPHLDNYWCTPAGGTLANCWLIADLGGLTHINKIEYTKRYHNSVGNDGYNCTGNLLDYILHYTTEETVTDSTVWTSLATGETVNGTTVITFAPVKATYVKLTATKSYHHAAVNTVMTCAEFAVYQAVCQDGEHVDADDDNTCDDCLQMICPEHIETPIPAVEATWTSTGLTEGVKCSNCQKVLVEQQVIPALYNQGIIPVDALSATAGSAQNNPTEGAATLALDDKFDTMWHTNWYPAANDKSGLWIDFALNGNYEVSGLRYKPRANAQNGTITKYQILISYDGINYVEFATGDWERNDEWKLLTFDNDVQPKHVRLVAVEAVSDQSSSSKYFASAAEIRLVGTPSDHTHDFTKEITTPATLTAPGEATYTCAGCDATYDVELPQLTVKNAKILDGNTVIALSECEYVLGGAENAYSLSHGGTYYVKPAANGTVIPQTQGEFSKLTLAWQDNGSVWIGSTLANNVEGGGSIHVWTAGADVPHWDRCGNGHGLGNKGTHDLFFFRADQNSTNAAIPGYTQVTAADVKVGESYLIAAKKGDSDWYIMYPTASTEKFDHIAQIVDDAVTHTHEYTETVTPATCQATGLKTNTCSCGHVHTEVIAINPDAHTPGAAATCGTAQTCTACGAELNAATGEHTWNDATCTAPKTCKTCGATEGEALGHKWVDADCDTPKTCSACGATEGEAAGHDWNDATCTAPKTCSACGATEGEALGHDWADADCDTPKTCKTCGATEGTALGHTAGEAIKENEVAPTLNSMGSYESVVKCSVCGKELSRKTVTVPALEGAAAVNGYNYATLAEAVEKAADGATVILLADVSLSEILTVDKPITINGNGKTLTSTATRAINIDTTGTVKIENLTINAGERAINIINQPATVTLDGVTATTKNNAVMIATSAGAANVTINNSDLTGLAVVNVAGAGAQVAIENTNITNVDADPDENYGAITVWSSAEKAKVTVTGGSITVADDSKKACIFPANATVEGVDDIGYIVATIGEAGFDTLAEAVKYAKDGNTVKLVRDVNTDQIIKIEKAITIDLNGKTVTSTAQKAFEVYADATIQNGTIEGVNRCVDTRKAVKLTLTDLTLVADNYSSAYGNPQPLTIGGSENGTVVNMTNVNINAKAGYGIITFVKTELTAKNSTISGYSALYVKPGSDNSEFKFVNTDLASSTADNDVEGNSFSTIAVRADNVTVNVDEASSVTAAGNYCCAISLGSKFEGEESVTGAKVTVAGTIEGNVLSKASLAGNTVTVPAACTAGLNDKGYAYTVNADGTVTAALAVAKIGNTNYATLAEAVAAAEAGATVTLLGDTTGAGVVIDKAITIDLGGYTYSFNEGVGSTGTESNGFQILAEARQVNINNGTLEIAKESADKFYTVIQNYTNICLTGVTVDATYADKWSKTDGDSYAVSNNGGMMIMFMEGTKIIANNDGDKAYAFDVYDHPSYEGEPSVMVWNSTIEGKVDAQATNGGAYFASFDAALTAAQGGTDKVITLLKPIEVTADTTYEIPANMTVESAGDAFVVSKGATLTLNGDGTVKAGTSGVDSWCAVFADGGDVVINGGTYSVGGDSSTTDTTHQNDVIYTKHGGTATINGGTFLNDGTVWTLNENDTTGGAITVYGGTFENWNPANNASEGANTNFVAEGYCSVLENGKYVVAAHIKGEVKVENEVAATLNNTGSYDNVVRCTRCDVVLSTETVTVPALTGAVASVNGIKYATFEEALAADGKVELLVPVTVTDDVTYNLEGETITSAGDAFVVTGGTLTLNGNGTVEAGTSGVGSWCAVFVDGGNVVINGGTYSVGGDSSTTDTTHQNDVIYTKHGGTATINGGTFLNDGTVWTLNENDTTGGAITVYGGTFENWNPADNVSEGAGTNFVAKGYCSVLVEGAYVVREHKVVDVAEVPADCGKTGTTAGTKCEFCGEILSGCTVTSALTHSFTTNYAMTRKPTAENTKAELTYYCDHNNAHTNVVKVDLPVAEVSPVDGNDYDLVFGQKFSVDTAKLTQAQIDAYAAWYVDFVITFNKDVTLHADMGEGVDGYLVGAYGEYGWIPVPMGNMDKVEIKADQPVKVMELAATLLGEPGLQYTAAEIFTRVQNFNCGVYLTPEYLAANPDLVITLELGLFEEKTTEAAASIQVVEGIYKAPSVVAAVDGVGYATLAEAVAAAEDGATVTLLDNTTGAGVVIDKDITIDLGGYTYTFNKTVGSVGTTTLGFQIIEGNNVTIENGTLTSTAVTEGKEVKVLIQNYANLTLTDVKLVDATDHIQYALSNNSGKIALNGSTSIDTDAVAFDVYDYSSAGYAVPEVTVNTTGTITGAIEVSETATLAISGGTFTVALDESWCAEGFIPSEKDENGNYTVVEGKRVTWYDEDGVNVLYTDLFAKDEDVVYGGETPTKSEDSTYTYEFKGWVEVEGGFKAEFEATEKVVETAKVTLISRQVFYDAELEMRVYLTIPESLADVDVVITKDGRWGTVSETVKGTELKTDNHGTYISIGVASGEMTRDITVEVLDGETALTLYRTTGDALGTSYTSTVKAWADWIVKNGDVKEKAAASAMLVYGGYAQKHFGVDADAPAYEGIVIPDLSAVTTDTVAAYATTQTNANLGVAAVGIEAHMDSYIEYRVYLSGNAEGYTFTVSGPDRTNEAVEAAYDAEEAKYYVSILDIAAAHMDETFTITVADANGNTNVITTSVLSWVRSVVNNPQLFTEAQIDLAKALYLYCVATSDLFGQ